MPDQNARYIGTRGVRAHDFLYIAITGTRQEKNTAVCIIITAQTNISFRTLATMALFESKMGSTTSKLRLSKYDSKHFPAKLLV